MSSTKKKIKGRASPRASRPVTAVAILRAARKIITPKQAWTQGTNARSANGFSINPTSPTATCWCARGAIMKAMDTDDMDAANKSDAFLALWRASPAQASGVISYNDADRRRHSTILAWFDRAIARANKSGPSGTRPEGKQ